MARHPYLADARSRRCPTILVNIFQFAIMLIGLLFGGHSLLHRWDQRETRRGLLKRACRAPEFVARTWLDPEADVKSPKLWLQFKGSKPYLVADGRKGCAEVVERLKAAGIAVDGVDAQSEASAG